MKVCVSIVWVSNRDIARELYSSSGNKQSVWEGVVERQFLGITSRIFVKY
jgi:hypothetical protein